MQTEIQEISVFLALLGLVLVGLFAILQNDTEL